jgi:cephalosporin-C deacetylase-like acetyl esterase
MLKGGGLMSYSMDDLKKKILQMYPEISKYSIDVSLELSEPKNAYIVHFKHDKGKDKHELTTHLEKKDAEECMNNIKCVYLGVQVGQFIKNFELQEKGI